MEKFVAGRPFDRSEDLKRRPLDYSLDKARSLISGFKSDVFRSSNRGDLTHAMQYALAGGKALRAFLVMESARINGVDTRKSAIPAFAIECIHAYSLIHDDLPCMDDDDLRRGQPTVHRKWNEYTAVLAGDALQALAFELLCHPSVGSAYTQLKLIRQLSVAAGYRGMVGGQMMDIEAETREAPYSLDQIIAVQNGKTGALIRWSATAGATLSDAEDDAWMALDRYGDKLGLAFQIWDDVLDVEGDAETVGKAVGKDADAGKATFVSLLGLDAAKKRAHDLVQDACDALSVYGDDTETLREAARFVVTRNN